MPEATSVLIFSIFKRLRQKERAFIHGKYFDSTAINLVPASDPDATEQPNRQCSVTFYAFPFLALQQPGILSDISGDSHPVRSLLQFQYAFESTTNHDEQQIMLEIGESSDVLHVPQVWILLINGGKSMLVGLKYSFLIFSQTSFSA